MCWRLVGWLLDSLEAAAGSSVVSCQGQGQVGRQPKVCTYLTLWCLLPATTSAIHLGFYYGWTGVSLFAPGFCLFFYDLPILICTVGILSRRLTLCTIRYLGEPSLFIHLCLLRISFLGEGSLGHII